MAVTKEIIIPIPKDAADANDLVLLLAKRERDLVKAEARLEEKVEKLTALVQVQCLPIVAEIGAIQTALATWADANRKELTNNNTVKFHDLPSGRLGWRANPASCKWKGKLNGTQIVAAVKVLRDRLLGSKDKEVQKQGVIVGTFIRTKEEPNKDAMLDNADLARQVEGVKIGSSGEVFYVEPAGAEAIRSAV